jgi:gliding motility-associated-like protein
VLRNGPPKYVKAGYKFPFILISPQLKSNFGSWPVNYIDAVIEYCKTYLRIDKSRIYLTGLSLGGGGVWSYAQDPVLVQKLAAIAVACGHQNNPAKACTLAATHLPVWAFHGDADNTVNVNKTISMVNAINACVPAPNPAALMTIYPGVGHNCWDNAFRTDHSLHNPNVYEWLLQYRNDGIVVNAGPDLSLNLPTNSTNITGSASVEGGTITSYTWSKVSGPAATITNASSPTVSITGLGAGVYTFRLSVTSNSGETAYDDVKITVLGVNQAPVANAGPDITLTLPTNAVTLNGSGSDPDGTISSYTWAKVSGPTVTLGATNAASLSLTNLLQGTYVFSLTVKDNLGSTSTDQVTVTVNAAATNQNPVANAGPDKTINLPTNTTNLTGSGSDPDGTITAYLWEKVTGPSVTMTNTNSATLSLSALLAGSYTFRLTVTDNKGAKASDDINVIVVAANQSPVANAGGDITITLPTNSTNINGSGSDPDGSIATYAWTQQAGPSSATLANTSSATLSVSNLLEGTYTFRLTVTDDKGSTALDDVNVIVKPAAVNSPPVANAGPDKNINLPTNSTTLAGTGSDADGTITKYQWDKISGPSVTMTNATSPTLILNNLLEGSYVFQLTVTDNQGATSSDQATVTVVNVNQSPVVNAGSDITITLPTNTSNITATASDPDGSIATYAWTQTDGPASAIITNGNLPTVTVSGLLEGTYIFRITVTDNQGSSAFDEINIIVNAAPVNIPPVANAGPDKTITLPLNTVTLNGSGTDTDGTIASYTWSVLSGPTATLSNENTPTLTASNLVAGTYQFKLIVKDNQGATNEDIAIVTVQPAPINQSPVANAGADVVLTLPSNSTTLSGSGSDPDGTISSYAWTKIQGPSATTSGENTATLALSNLIAGTYIFELSVTDDQGSTDTDQVTVQVNAANVGPTADAGSDVTINLPTNSTTLTGSGTDSDGSITSYGWTQVDGPSIATLTNSNTAVLSVSNLIAGTYTFMLTVTDNNGATGTDNVKVIVNASNLSPVASAGPDKTITLPTNTATFTGNGTDADGTIASYTWTQTSGPVMAALSNENTNTLTVLTGIEGTYVFRLTVTDNGGASDYDDVQLIVNPAAVNQPPVAEAGPNQTITLPLNVLTLAGSASDPDGSITSYKWIKTKGPTATLTNGTTPTLSLSNLLAGSYIFRLTVTDNGGLTAFDEVTVTVLPEVVNQVPVANAGPDKSITLPTNSLTLSGSGSDADGTVTSYAWSQVGGSSATLTNTTNATLTVSDLTAGSYTFRLTVTDDKGATGADDVSVVVNPAAVNQVPIANAGADQTITLPVNSLNLSGSGSDADGSIVSYQWVKVSGSTVTLANDNTPVVSLSNLLAGTYVFRLTVKDNGNATASDDVTVTVLPQTVNQIPVANAGADQVLTLPNNIMTLFGAGSDVDGTIVTYSWTKVSGGAATLANESTANLTVSDLVAGVYVFRLTVTDDKNATGSDDVKVTVNAVAANIPPVANAGGNQTITLPTTIANLNGIGSDADGSITQYTWIKVSGPAVTLGATDQPILSVSNLVEGTYVFRLTVKDNNGATSSDNATITVLPATLNKAPIVNAGPDVTLTEPTSTVLLEGSAADVDGTITSLGWTQVSGASVTMTNQNTTALNVNGLTVGVYKFRLTATDNQSASSFDEATVTVQAATANKPPVANAGSDITIKLPVNTVTLTGSATDPDGTIASTVWIEKSGPSATLSNENTTTLTVSNMLEGIYVFSLQVTDNNGDATTDEVTVTVLPASLNSNPVADAGPDTSVELPSNATILNGSATDDGTVVSTVWTQVSGGSVSLSGENTTTLSVSGLVEGSYVFRLTVTDDGGLTDSDDVIVTVFPEPSAVLPPTVDAGEDKLVHLPDNSISITAKADAPDGLIISYKWSQLAGNTVNFVDTLTTLSVSDLSAGEYTFQIMVTDGNGQIATDQVNVVVLEEEPTAKPHNLFSPDNKGDISTETWTIENATLLNGCEIIVYSRQGQKVFSSIGYPVPWDGNYNGKPVPDGAYYYVIRCSGQKSQTGSVTIARLK